ncbi:MAG: DUF4974 domain-containing protein [Tannerella sp.]|jgi:ferric-dicitrate binding protein FerR (iron transport regulator)|nr:DUF4974 domain-containing protein [Tannerella sp.]
MKKMKDEYMDMSREEPDGTLLIRYIRGISSDGEDARVASWLDENQDNEKTLLQIARIYYARRTQERIRRRNPVTALAKVLRRRQRKARRVWLQRLAVAACAAVVIVSVAGSYFVMQEKPATQYVTVQTNAGMRTSLNLPDGTLVHLNSSSKLTYPVPFEAGQRRVTLDGEGYFQVAHDVQRPFIVQAESRLMEVEAVGTAFNMQAYASESLLKTTLVEGAVRFGVQNESGTWKYELLNPSEKAVYDLTARKVHISRTNPVYDTAWMQGRLMFRDTPLPEVLAQLSRFYNVTFDVADAVINSYMFTGTFENRQLSQIMDYLKISSRVNYRIIQSAEDDSRGVKRTKVVLKKI